MTETTNGATALLFPGQGAQVVGMGADLHERFESVRALYAQANAPVEFDLAKISFEGPEDELRRTDVSQPAILVASLAAHGAVNELAAGKLAEPAAVAGLSLGEYTALVAAGALSLEDAIRLVIERGRFMQECCDAQPSGMASVVGASPEVVKDAVAVGAKTGVVVVANWNSPRQIVISGEKAALDAACAAAKDNGARRVLPLPVAGAYHSPLMAPAGVKLATVLSDVEIRKPSCRYVSNVTAQFEDDPDRIRELLVRQVSSPVRWQESIELLVKSGITRAYELGPGTVLAGLCKQIDRALSVVSAQGVAEAEAMAAGLAE